MKLIFTATFVFILIYSGFAQSVSSPTPNCTCPALSVSGPSDLVLPGQSAIFTAKVSGGTQNNITYNWIFSAGNIMSGQETPTITVTAEQGASVRATVEIGGLCSDCHKTAGATADWGIIPKLIGHNVDEFGEAKPDEIKAKLDIVFVELNNDPTATGYITNYGTAKEKAKRIRIIYQAIAFRKFPKDRIKFIDGGEGPLKTELLVAPQGAAAPK